MGRKMVLLPIRKQDVCRENWDVLHLGASQHGLYKHTIAMLQELYENQLDEMEYPVFGQTCLV